MPEVKVQKVPAANDRTLPVFSELDNLADRIRIEAYKLFARRGTGDGHALDDWLTAEQELCWPSAELIERDGAYALKIALAGFEPGEITVTATPREIIVKAAHKDEKKSAGETKTMTCWSEFRSNNVFRRVELPAPVDVERTSANFRNGLLEITAPQARAAAETAKSIEVSSGS
jgi:HSP20 family protein